MHHTAPQAMRLAAMIGALGLPLGTVSCVAPTGPGGEHGGAGGGKGDVNATGDIADVAPASGASLSVGRDGELVLETPAGTLHASYADRGDPGFSHGDALVFRNAEGSIAEVEFLEPPPHVELTNADGEPVVSEHRFVLDFARVQEHAPEIAHTIGEIGEDVLVASREGTLTGPRLASAEDPGVAGCVAEAPVAPFDFEEGSTCDEGTQSYSAWLGEVRIDNPFRGDFWITYGCVLGGTIRYVSSSFWTTLRYEACRVSSAL